MKTRPGIMHGSCKVHKRCVDGFPLFRPILSALRTRTHKLAKFLVPILKPITTNKCTIKVSFSFATEFFDQDSSNFMGSLDIDSLFTKPLSCRNHRNLYQ